MSGAYCPKCPCESCKRARTFVQPSDPWRPSVVPTIQQTGLGQPECAYERIAKEYADRGETLPTSLLLYCGCPKCSIWC